MAAILLSTIATKLMIGTVQKHPVTRRRDWGEMDLQRQLVLVCNSPSSDQRIVALPRAPLTLGRSRDCDIVVRDPRVSRRHVVFEQTPEGCTLRRREEAAPVYVNHREVDSAVLRAGDLVRIGTCCMVLVEAGDEAPVTPLWDGERIEHELRWWLQGFADVIGSELCWRGDQSAADAGAPAVTAFDIRQTAVAQGTLLEAAIPSGALAAVRVTLRQPAAEVTPFILRLFGAIASVCGVVALERSAAATIEVKPCARPSLPSPSNGRSQYIGDSAAAQRLKRLIGRIAPTQATVLLVGESGTGKSLVARLLHDQSARAGRPFHVVNCAAIPESLIESELFGHTRGAFTGAVDTRAGAFEVAGDGTIFLDEVAELPLTSQAKLLRVLEERSFQRIGSSRQQSMEARIIAATNGNLKRMVEEGRMRPDLYYRLSVVRVEIPMLRERGDDVILIAEHLLHELALRNGRAVAGFSPGAMETIRAYGWPGNVRELRNAIETAVVLGEGRWIEAGDLSITVGTQLALVDEDDENMVQLPMSLAKLETKAIKAALLATSGNRTRAASLLGINRVTLYKKLCQSTGERPAETSRDEGEAVG
jgi:two-component system response regulator HydG